MKPNEKALYIEIDVELHEEIRKAAHEKYISMKKYVLQAVTESLARDGKLQG